MIPSPALQAPALVNATAAAIDDADALPAVGKVWDSGPKRSLSEIFAAQAKKTQQQQPDQPATPPIADGLQPLWEALLQRVQQQLGNSVHIPLLSGQPRREGDILVVRLTGPFAHIGKMLEKYRDQVAALASEVAGTTLGFRLELDATAPAAPSPAARSGGPATNSPAQQSAISAPAVREGIPITPELRQELEKDPLIRSLLVDFNGTIVKVEQK